MDERIDYLTAVASIAFADGTTDREELARINEMCAELGVTGEGAERVTAAASAPDRAQVEGILGRFAKTKLRVTMLIDAMVVAYADGRVDTGEAAEIARYAKVLGFTSEEVVRVGRYVEESLGGPQGGEALADDLAAKLADLAADVPSQGVVRGLFDRIRKR